MTTYVPISFDREFTSICVSTMHGSLIDYRFRVRNYRADHASSLHKDGDTFVENGILVELKYIDIAAPEDSPDSAKRKK